jgi:hypothetical protein
VQVAHEVNKGHEGSRFWILTDDHAVTPEDVDGFLKLTALHWTPAFAGVTIHYNM